LIAFFEEQIGKSRSIDSANGFVQNRMGYRMQKVVGIWMVMTTMTMRMTTMTTRRRRMMMIMIMMMYIHI